MPTRKVGFGQLPLSVVKSLTITTRKKLTVHQTWKCLTYYRFGEFNGLEFNAMHGFANLHSMEIYNYGKSKFFLLPLKVHSIAILYCWFYIYSKLNTYVYLKIDLMVRRKKNRFPQFSLPLSKASRSLCEICKTTEFSRFFTLLFSFIHN